MKLFPVEIAQCLRYAADPHATPDEANLLSSVASLSLAGEPLTRAQYLRCGSLCGWALSTTTPIMDR